MTETGSVKPPTFGQRFRERSERYGTLCVGIDPHQSIMEQWGLPYTADGLRKFSDICVSAFADTTAVVKPQVAFYERFGAAGFAVLEQTIADLRSTGVLVIADAKRGDIGSTMAGYAEAWLGEGATLECDALTVTPWLGFDALQPVFDLAEEQSKGAIVLAATSNPEAPSIQDGITADGQKLSDHICNKVAEWNARHDGPGNLGVVVGATVDDAPDLDQLNGMILMPGVGAQGGTMNDVRRITGNSFPLAAPNVSRGILGSGPTKEKLQAAVHRFAEELLK